jgi:hypothetical protein
MAMIKWTAVTAKKTPRPNVRKAATKASKAPERSPTTSVVVETVAFGQPARPPQCSSTCTSATMGQGGACTARWHKRERTRASG